MKSKIIYYGLIAGGIFLFVGLIVLTSKMEADKKAARNEEKQTCLLREGSEWLEDDSYQNRNKIDKYRCYSKEEACELKVSYANQAASGGTPYCDKNNELRFAP